MVHGKGILMVDAAHWLARHRLLAVWSEPTVMQMLAAGDDLRATEAAIVKPDVQGIYARSLHPRLDPHRPRLALGRHTTHPRRTAAGTSIPHTPVGSPHSLNL